jgi:hypothetical protein
MSKQLPTQERIEQIKHAFDAAESEEDKVGVVIDHFPDITDMDELDLIRELLFAGKDGWQLFL